MRANRLVTMSAVCTFSLQSLCAYAQDGDQAHSLQTNSDGTTTYQSGSMVLRLSTMIKVSFYG